MARRSGQNSIALIFQLFDAAFCCRCVIFGLFKFTLVSMYRQPLAGSASDVRIRLEATERFDDVDILNTKAIARSQAGTRVVAVSDVFQNNSQVASSLTCDFMNAFDSFCG